MFKARPKRGRVARVPDAHAHSPTAFLEQLEARTHLSVNTPEVAWPPLLTWTESSARGYTTGWTQPASDGQVEEPAPSSIIQSLINLDDFRADHRFNTIDGRGFASVIIDTGIDRNHAFFGADVNRNGVADRIVYSYDFADNDSDASDRDGHGSNVSSIVASGDSTYGGVAPGSNIIHLKVFRDGEDFFDFKVLEKALRWVVSSVSRYNIASVNMSLGNSANYASLPPVERALYGISDELAALAALNVIVVAAAGNDYGAHRSAPGLSYPAADPSVLAVGAVYSHSIGTVGYGAGTRAQRTGPDRITPFSQRSRSQWQIFAPGAPVTGASESGGLVTQHGTSQAAPHVTGVATLMQQLAGELLGRRLTVSEFRNLLMRTGTRIVDGDDERDSVLNTGADFKRLDVMALARALWNKAGPEVRLKLATTNLVDGAGRVEFGSTVHGTSIEKTFTVENSGAEWLELSGLAAPAGFSIAAPFGETQLAPGQSTTFTVRFNGTTIGRTIGEVRFRTNDSDERQYSFTVSATASVLAVITDDGTSSVRLTGDWNVEHGGYSGDFRVKDPGVGNAKAEWTFNNLIPGRYKVYLTWPASSELATNAPFSLDDGTSVPFARLVNQRSAPNDLRISSVDWELLGEYEIFSTRAIVELRDSGNGPVVADGVRFERVGVLEGGPRLAVTIGSTTLLDDDLTHSFGASTSGRPIQRTLVLRNIGDADLFIGRDFTLPGGFSVVTPPAARLKPGTSTSMIVKMDAGAPGPLLGRLEIPTNSEFSPLFRVNISGTVSPMIRTLDDGSPGFTTVGTWTLTRPGYSGDGRAHASGTGSSYAWWSFTGLTAGLYRISATWAGTATPNPTMATNASFIISQGEPVIGTASVNQQTAPTQERLSNTWWQHLGAFRITGTRLDVVLRDLADGMVLADAIRIERIDN